MEYHARSPTFSPFI
ncbi:Protein of unknown function [Leuconostoc citreum]|nr:Protein of unknown function [Leuconostoc citreum]